MGEPCGPGASTVTPIWRYSPSRFPLSAVRSMSPSCCSIRTLASRSRMLRSWSRSHRSPSPTAAYAASPPSKPPRISSCGPPSSTCRSPDHVRWLSRSTGPVIEQRFRSIWTSAPLIFSDGSLALDPLAHVANDALHDSSPTGSLESAAAQNDKTPFTSLLRTEHGRRAAQDDPVERQDDERRPERRDQRCHHAPTAVEISISGGSIRPRVELNTIVPTLLIGVGPDRGNPSRGEGRPNRLGRTSQPARLPLPLDGDSAAGLGWLGGGRGGDRRLGGGRFDVAVEDLAELAEPLAGDR